MLCQKLEKVLEVCIFKLFCFEATHIHQLLHLRLINRPPVIKHQLQSIQQHLLLGHWDALTVPQ